jgi:Cu/Ag efflux pump CusA
VAWLDTIRSESIPGLSRVELIFEPGTDLLRARQMVGLSSRELSPIELSVLARWTIRPRLMGVSGVANVAIWGQRERQLQVQADPEKLAEHGVTFNQVVESTGNALWVSPLTFLEASTPGTGGFIATPNQRLGIRHVLPITTPEDLARVTVDDAGPKPRGSGYDDFGAGSPRRW